VLGTPGPAPHGAPTGTPGGELPGRTVVLVETKTKNAHRTVGFGPALVAVMRQAKADQALRRLAIGEGWRDFGLGWTTRTDPRSTRSD
jgi:hypothetical protein